MGQVTWSTTVTPTNSKTCVHQVQLILTNGEGKSVEVLLNPRDTALLNMHLVSASIECIDLNKGKAK